MLIMFNKHNVHARKEAGFWGRESRPTDTKTFPAQTQTLRPAQSISMSTCTAVPIHFPSAQPHMGSELLCLSISVHTISIPHDSCFTGLTTALPSIKEPKSTGQEAALCLNAAPLVLLVRNMLSSPLAAVNLVITWSCWWSEVWSTSTMKKSWGNLL